MKISRKHWRDLFFLYFVMLLQNVFFSKNGELLAAEYEFDNIMPEWRLSREIEDGIATGTQFLDLNNKTDVKLRPFFEKHFNVDGSFGELKTGGLVRDWDKVAENSNISGEKFKNIYETWLRQKRVEFEQMRSGNAEFYNKFFDENFENSENNAPAGRRYSAKNSENPVLKNGEIFTNWEDFAQKKGLPAGGAILAGLYALWRRRKKEKVQNLLEFSRKTKKLTDLVEKNLANKKLARKRAFENQLRQVFTNFSQTEINQLITGDLVPKNKFQREFIENVDMETSPEKLFPKRKYEAIEPQKVDNFIENLKNSNKLTQKIADLNTNDVEQAAKIVEGSCRSMGIEVA